MRQIKYQVVITYTDLFGKKNKVCYKPFASNDEEARVIALELLLVNEGTFTDTDTDVTLVRPSLEEQDSVRKYLMNTYGVVKEKFGELTYQGFINAIEQYEGYDIRLGATSSSFRFKFRGLVCLVRHSSGVTSIDENELFVTINNRTYIVTNGLRDIYIGV